MFKWIRRRRQRKDIQDRLEVLMRCKHIWPPPYFLSRLRQYDEKVFDSILQTRVNKLFKVFQYPYSRQRDRVRALKRVRQQFLEAVQNAL